MSDSLNREIKEADKINECVIIFKCADCGGSCLYFKDERNEGECKYCFGGDCTNIQAQAEEIERTFKIWTRVEQTEKKGNKNA